MRPLLVAALVVVFPFALRGNSQGTAAQGAVAQGGAAAPAGNPEAGKAVWATGNTSCRNCHGGDGEGGFGPRLAGRNLVLDRFKNQVRNPTDRMPAYLESELTDREMADLVAYFNSLPPAEAPGAWRFKPPDGAPRGQLLAVGLIGCGQCHGLTLTTPRHGAAEVNGDWEWFKRMVYEHTTAQREQWSQLDPQIPAVTPSPAGPPGRNRLRMGNYSRSLLPESTLREIFTWMTDLGPLVPLSGRLSAGVAGDNGVTYTLDVANAGVRGKGLTAEGVTVTLVLPAGSKVVNSMGAGYRGVQRDEEVKGDVAVWEVPRLAAAERQKVEITLSGTTAAADPPRGTIRWAKPAVKSDPIVNITRPGGGRGGGRGTAAAAQ